MPHTRLRPNYTFDQDRLDQLRAVVPEAFADGKIDWDTLRDLLGDAVEDPAVEHFGLSWPGKRDARRLASRPSRGALIPVPGEGVNEDTTRNVFIEGENLEVLKLLLKSYAGRVKMIYIDPPYNTGNDFIYNDDFSEPVEAYLRLLDLADEQGPLQSNPKISGRYHSKWLDMMYPRLRLARSLLSEDGVIFVSIDDNELCNLKAIMNEVFGEESFIANFVRKRRMTTGMRAEPISPDHEYVLTFAKDPLGVRLFGRERSEEDYPFRDVKGKYRSTDLTVGMNKHMRPNQYFAIEHPRTGNKYWPSENRVWRFQPSTMQQHIKDDNIIWPDDLVDSRLSRPRFKTRYSPDEAQATPVSTWIELRKPDSELEPSGNRFMIAGMNQDGTKELRDLFGTQVLEYPKPVSLLKALVALATSDGDLIVDFFAGSCTTAQAVLEINQEQATARQFVVVQLPEPTQEGAAGRRAGFSTVAEIGKERVRKAIHRIIEDQAGKLPLEGNVVDDLGFRVYRLERSHFKPWTDYNDDNVAALQAQFDVFESPLVDGWAPDALLVEIVLMEGFPLDSTVTRQTQFAANDVRLVESDFHEHRLWVCLDQRVEASTVSDLVMTNNDVFICLDSALDDEMKLRLSDGGNLKTI